MRYTIIFTNGKPLEQAASIASAKRKIKKILGWSRIFTAKASGSDLIPDQYCYESAADRTADDDNSCCMAVISRVDPRRPKF